MRKELFIAKRILFAKEGNKTVSPPAIRIAIASMALGIIVIILAVAIVIGFKREVANKVIGFNSHIQVSSIKAINSYETIPVAFSDSLIEDLNRLPNVNHIARFGTLPGIIKTDNDFHGIILKGIDEEYSWELFGENLIEGELLTVNPDSTTTNVMISKNIADKLHLKLGDSFLTYFLQEPLRVRKFTISGIYASNFSDYDKLFVFGDIKQIRRLGAWEQDMASGLEISLKNYEQLDETTESIFYSLAGKRDRLGNAYYVRSIKEMNPMIFEWLSALDMNTVVILTLMLIVAGFSMISGLLIIIIERANMIGLLKAMGENNTSIRTIFLIISLFLTTKGLLWGNLIGLGFCFVQKYFHILKLNPVDYYISEVPIYLNGWIILLINFGTLFVTLLMLLGPSYMIAKISPAKTIRFE